MDTTDLFDILVQDVERCAFPYFYAKTEYHENRRSGLEHVHWLEEHLDEEARAHLEKLQDADLCVDTLEREALVKVAIALGIRFALPH